MAGLQEEMSLKNDWAGFVLVLPVALLELVAKASWGARLLPGRLVWLQGRSLYICTVFLCLQ